MPSRSRFPTKAASMAVLAWTLTAAPAALANSAKVEALIGRMTLDEKIGFLHGQDDPEHLAGGGYIPGVARLNIPPLRLADGPAGVRTSRTATAFPAPVALTSTFSPDLAKAWGAAVASEALARDQHVLLAPMTNNVRVPTAGRNFETFGEDPLLASRLVAASVAGLQGGGVIATVKHFAANNQETDRKTIDVQVDERTLREIEFPPFQAAVDAGVGAVMCAYNKVGGLAACENPFLLEKVLRQEWGYGGFVMSDWGATHSAAPSVKAGLDMEMPRGKFLGEALKDAVAKGELTEADIDRSVRRILTQMNRIGMLGEAVQRPFEDGAQRKAHADLALEIALEGAVLLKNDGGVLPLSAATLQKVAVIGPTAKRALYGGGGSAEVKPTALDNPYEALGAQAGAPLVFAEGLRLEGEPIAATALGSDSGPGLAGATGPFIGAASLDKSQSASWEGWITVPETGDYELMLQFTPVGGLALAEADRGMADVELDGKRIIEGGRLFGGARLIKTSDGLLNQGQVVHLEAGVRHRLKLSVKASAVEPLRLRLAWTTPALRRQLLDAAAAAAKAAPVAIVFAHVEGTEGEDNRSLALPYRQDELIEAVARANPNTVVVLNTGAPVLMPWLGQVKAVLQMWYPGQRGGEATADLLTGKANPSGRLPVTFPASDSQTAVAQPERFPGIDGHQTYSEGVLVGYRWYDALGAKPLFPFGYGLSYTRFQYGELKVTPAADGLDVAFTLRNAGPADGAEVAQVYIDGPTAPPEGLTFAPRILAGFQRVTLRAGESREIHVKVERRALSYWSPQAKAWRQPPGPRRVRVGGSSRDLPLSRTVEAHP
ncbi:glycoside hydrolase family 3 C-terminal domain-containing protein [Caulobacter sp. 602-1]|uniref:beta-glucosidase H n=1 Tax=Caulobacter sp. 602-1 TaxID=2492472 RepID=UPI0013157BA1|nr:beta-glucosidase [Caulobacter sp. 602-1]